MSGVRFCQALLRAQKLVACNVGTTPTYRRVNAKSIVDVTFARSPPSNRLHVSNCYGLGDYYSPSDHEYVEFAIAAPAVCSVARDASLGSMIGGWTLRKLPTKPCVHIGIEWVLSLLYQPAQRSRPISYTACSPMPAMRPCHVEFLFPSPPPTDWASIPISLAISTKLDAELVKVHCVEQSASFFTAEELRRAARGLPSNKAPGPDYIPNEIIRLTVSRIPDLFLFIGRTLSRQVEESASGSSLQRTK